MDPHLTSKRLIGPELMLNCILFAVIIYLPIGRAGKAGEGYNNLKKR